MNPPIDRNLFNKLNPMTNVSRREYLKHEQHRMASEDIVEGEILRTYQRRSGLYIFHDSYISSNVRHNTGRAIVSLVLKKDADLGTAQVHVDNDKYIYVDATNPVPSGFFTSHDSTGGTPEFSAAEFADFQRSLTQELVLL